MAGRLRYGELWYGLMWCGWRGAFSLGLLRTGEFGLGRLGELGSGELSFVAVRYGRRGESNSERRTPNGLSMETYELRES